MVVPKKTSKRLSHKCGECKKAVPDSCKAVQCEAECELWYHIDCVGLSVSGYEELSDDDQWLCPKCELMNSNKLLKMEIRNLTSIIETLQSDLKEMSNICDDLRKNNSCLSDIALQRELEIVSLKRVEEFQEVKNMSSRSNKIGLLSKQRSSVDRHSRVNGSPVRVSNKFSSLYVEEPKSDRNIDNNFDLSMTDFPPLTRPSRNRISSTPSGRFAKRNWPPVSERIVRRSEKDTFRNRNHLPCSVQDKNVLLDNNDIGLESLGVTKSSGTKHRLLILSDSHGRDLGRYLNLTVNTDRFNVLSVCKPGAKMWEVMSGLEGFTEGYTKQDVVVIIGGSNNVDKGVRSILMKSIEKRLMTLSKKTNVVLSALPWRYDKNEYNEVVHLCNKNLYGSILSGNVDFLPFNEIKRHNFTNHGQHLHKKGKFILASYILNACKECLSRHSRPICHQDCQDKSFLG